MGIIAKNMILCLLFLANLLQTMAESKLNCRITDKYEVHVVNNLPSNLRLHCASGDNDLGHHILGRNTDFHWEFCESYLGNTLFFCHLFWGSKDIAFDVFRSQDKRRCPRGACFYAAKPDGIYFSGYYPPRALEKIYDWKNGHVQWSNCLTIIIFVKQNG